MNENEQISLFYSYAHNDGALRNELDKHLSILHKEVLLLSGMIVISAREKNGLDQVDHHLNIAHIIYY